MLYFAIGAMVRLFIDHRKSSNSDNRLKSHAADEPSVSLSMRGLTPTRSWPAEILDYELVFYRAASAFPKLGSSFHGVVHEMTASDMENLDVYEASYSRKDCTVRLYDGSLRNATVYTMNENGKKILDEGLLPERYMELLIDGAIHYKVAQSHIDFLKSIPFTPRAKPEEFRKFNVPSDLPIWTMKEVTTGDGEEGNPIYLTMNGKVLHFTGNESFFFYQGLIKRYATTNVELPYSKSIYEPKYGTHDNMHEFTKEHCDYIEDAWVRLASDNFEVVALFEQVYADGMSSIGRGIGDT